MRTCEADGCTKKHRARGLCSTHYNQTHSPNRHRTEKVCAECSKAYVTTRMNGRFCSVTCSKAEMVRQTRAREDARRVRIPEMRRLRARDLRSPIRAAIEDGGDILSAIYDASIETASGCWEWSRTLDDGYPVAQWKKRGGSGMVRHAIHRLSLEVRMGKPLGDQPAHHVCANSKCVNPDHLQPVTHAENTAEMLARTYMMRRIRALEAALREASPDHPALNEVGVPLTPA